MAEEFDGNVKAFPAGGAIAAHLLVKLTSGVLSVAGLGEHPIGVMTHRAAFAAGEIAPVRLISCSGTMKCKASGPFSQGALVYGRASGLIDDIATTAAVAIGVALEAATAANDIIEVMPKAVS